MTSPEHRGGEDYARMWSAILQDGRHHAHHRFLAIKHRSKWKLLQKHVPTQGAHATPADPAPASCAMERNKGATASSASRSVSLASVSSEGSSESHLVEQEDIVALTQEVRAFKEALGKLRRIFHHDKEGGATVPALQQQQPNVRVLAHERLGQVLRILRNILGRYPALQATELLVAAASLIQQVEEHQYDDEKSDPKEFMESIDQVALAFSSRVSEYLMGDLDSNISLGSSVSSKTKSFENLPSDMESSVEYREGKDGAASAAASSSSADQQLSGSQMDAILLSHEQGVEVALHRAKLWSKYAKVIMTYVEKRCNLEMDIARKVATLAQTMKAELKAESYLPFQSVYITAMDREIDNSNSAQSTCSMLTGHKFIEPLSARRNEHERCRKQIKETWHRELKRMQEAVSNLRKAKALYVQRQQDWERAKEAALNVAEVSPHEVSKLDKRKKTEEDALLKAMEAETSYKACVSEANDRHSQLLRVKSQVLQQVRELMLQCDQTMKAVTVSYFHLQQSVAAPPPVQFQTLCDSSRLYEPGSQYMEFLRKMYLPSKPVRRDSSQTNQMVQGHLGPYSFEPYSEESTDVKSNGSLSTDNSDGKDRAGGAQRGPMKAWSASSRPNSVSGSNVITQVSSDTESFESSPSVKSRETSPTASPMCPARRLVPGLSTEELENDADPEVDSSFLGYNPTRRDCMSKAAVTHTFRKLKTPSRCRECDSYVYFQGLECVECGLSCHKKCLESLTIQCGHKRLPRKMTTFGVDLSQHLSETRTNVPPILAKCINEIDARGIHTKGLYRVSGVKSKVEKICQSFENGADLVDLTDIHPNVVANVLKLYLRQLPESLLTSRLYPDFVRLAKDTPVSSAMVVEDLREICLKLPRHHYATLALLMHHLKRVADEADSNNMPCSNLGIVFGPTLLRTCEGSASLSSLVDTVHQTKVIELLISNANEIFGLPDSLLREHGSTPRIPRLAKSEEITAASLLCKVPVVRSISFLEKHRKYRDNETIVSTPADRRPELREEVNLPGFVADSKTPDIDAAKASSFTVEESITAAAASDEDLPDFLLPDDSNKTRKLPIFRTGSAPKIFKSSLKDYHGLEGVNLNLLSNLETQPPTPTRTKKVSAAEASATSPQSTAFPDSVLGSLTSTAGEIYHTSTVQTASQSKMATIQTPLMDSSIDSDHSWESHSTGSSGRGTQHSDQGSLGSTKRTNHMLLPTHDRDETDGPAESPFSSLAGVNRTLHDENRVKIQVPSSPPAPAIEKESTSAWSTATIARSGSSSSNSNSNSNSNCSISITRMSSTAESRGVVTILEGPVSGTTWLSSTDPVNDPTSKSWLVGGGRSNTTPAVSTTGATNLIGASGGAPLPTVPVALTHEIAHSVFRSATTAVSTTVDNKCSSISSSSSSISSSSTNSSSSSSSQQVGQRVPKFV